MNDAEEMLEEIEKQFLKHKSNINDMMSNTTYINWLNQFTQDKDGFTDDQWLFFPEKISDVDRKNVHKLNLFYEGIDEYAKENYIYPIACKFGYYYKVKFNDFSFKIGYLTGQGTIFFFDKIDLEKDELFIDFNDILIKKKQDNVDQINTSLDSLSRSIISIYESGVPIEAITNTFNNTIKNITSKEESKTKKLIK